MQTLEAAKEQQSQPMAGDSQQSKQIPSEMVNTFQCLPPTNYFHAFWDFVNV